jgi:hypothetical protein
MTGGIPKLFYELWFPKNTQNITIVAPPSNDGLADAELTSRNYALLDRLGDRDTIYAIGKLLSRRYPNAVIHLASAEDFKRPNFSQNFVIIGGPGGVESALSGTLDPLVGNPVCRHFSDRFLSRFRYSEDCETLHVGVDSFVATNDAQGHMTKDYGVFTAFVNPYLRSTRIVMLHGIHTLGVLGAARLFDGQLDSVRNFAQLEQLEGLDWKVLRGGFECFFSVNILYGEVECPSFDAGNIFALNDRSGTMMTRTTLFPAGQEPKSLMSATELRRDIVDRLKVARQQTLSVNLPDLNQILSSIEAIAQPELDLMQRILEACRQNSRVPPASIRKIKDILNDDTT